MISSLSTRITPENGLDVHVDDMTDDLEWYCLRTKPRNERLTSNFLRVRTAVEVFCPFVRFERARRSGKLWVTEAMFPGYVFARFRYVSQCRQIRATRGVVKIVSFGEVPARVSSEIIDELRNAVQDQETIVIQPGIEVGEEVNVIAGPFRGLRAVVSRVMPARERSCRPASRFSAWSARWRFRSIQ